MTKGVIGRILDITHSDSFNFSARIKIEQTFVFKGYDRTNVGHDSLNFFARTKIEQTFGFLLIKWRIVRRPVRMNVANASKLFIVLTRMHNYIINKNEAPV